MKKYGITGIAEYYGVEKYAPKSILKLMEGIGSDDAFLWTYKDSYFILEYDPDDQYMMATIYVHGTDFDLEAFQEKLGDLLKAKSSVFTSIDRGIVEDYEFDEPVDYSHIPVLGTYLN
jgi:hypothetical protein